MTFGPEAFFCCFAVVLFSSCLTSSIFVLPQLCFMKFWGERIKGGSGRQGVVVTGRKCSFILYELLMDFLTLSNKV